MQVSFRFRNLIRYTVISGVLLLLLAGSIPQPLSEKIPGSSIENLTFYTEQLPPYNFVENGTLKGLSVDLLEAATAKMGTKVSRENVHVVPWEEGYRSVLTGNGSVLFVVARTPEREHSFQWVGPVTSGNYVLFASYDRNISIKSPEDLKGYRIGVITDDFSIKQLLNAGVDESQFVRENNSSVLVTKLENGEIDLWCSPELTGRYFAGQVTGNGSSFQVVYPLEDVGIYYAFSSDIPNSTVRSFQDALDETKLEKYDSGISTYEQILGRYIPSAVFVHLQYLVGMGFFCLE